MGINTDLEQAPYYDDFDESKNFHRVLFKPGYAVQARELNQTQSILQNQIERIGNNLFREGTILEGCTFTEVDDLAFLKLKDLSANGTAIDIQSFLGAKAIGVVSGVEGIVVSVSSGYESQAPDLNTIYVKYTKVGNTYTSGANTYNYKRFLSTENIQLRNVDTNDLIDIAVGSGEGSSYGVRCTDGIIYQKGMAVRVDAQLAIVSKYSNTPDGIVVGFETTETIVNSYEDLTLLDNAQGYNNYNAPGADRLVMTPVLVAKTLAEAAAEEHFFALQEYANGKLIRRNKSTEYDSILGVMEQRTREESGNYTVEDFPISVTEHASNTSLLSVNIGAGKAYVEGKRVELLNTFNIDLHKSTTNKTEIAQSIATNYGNYIVVNDLFGNFDPHLANTVTLYNTALNAYAGNTVPAANASQEIGTARVRSVIVDAPNLVAANDQMYNANTEYRVYLFDIKLNSGQSFNNVAAIRYGNTAAGGDDAGCADLVSATVFETGFKKALFPAGRSSLKSLPAPATSVDYIHRTVNKSLSIAANGSITIGLTEGVWPYAVGALNSTQLRDIILIPRATAAPYSKGKPINLTSNTITATVTSTTSLTISGLPAVAVTATGYYNVKQTYTQPSKKDLTVAYVKIDCSNNAATTNGPWSLGVADPYIIDKVYVATSFTGIEDPTNDKTSFFYLDKGATDTYYGLGYLRKNSGISLTGSSKILVKLRAFKKNITGSYADGFFTVNSYPIDDANTANTAAIQTQYIPTHKLENGDIVSLRDYVDFRPVAANTAVYASDAATATTNPANTVSFGSTDLYLPAPNKEFEADYEYYLSRKDLVLLDADGNFVVYEGQPSENPVPPSDPSSGMILATLNVPAYPSLARRTADVLGKPEMGVAISKKDNRRYTMRDIGNIEQRITNLEYYTSLNALEVKTKDLIITDSSGLDRFKNGIFVDNFEDLSAANVLNSEYAAGIDPTFKELTPKFNAYPLDLEVYNTGSWVNTTRYADAVTMLKSSDKKFINQPYATEYRNCVVDFYKYSGTAIIDPVYDSSYDTVTAPTVNINIDLTSAFADYTEALAQYVPLSQTSSAVSRATIAAANNRVTTSFTTTTSTTALTVNSGSVKKQNVGEFVTDITFSPYLRARNITINAYGLKPNTRHYFYFDNVSVNDHVFQAQVLASGKFRPTKKKGEAVYSNSDGTLYAIFQLPEKTFFVGDRVLTINDVDDPNADNAAVSAASATYRGFNYSIEKTGISVATRQTDTSVQTTTKSVTTSSTRVITTQQTAGDRERNGKPDPIAQTFNIEENMTTDNVVMLTKMDLFFKKKGTVGVTVQIRETENGYPSEKILPFGTKRLLASEINVSDNAAVATTVTFDAPVTLKSGVDYCFVVLPDGSSPDFLLFTSKTGGTDLTTGLAVSMDYNSGTLFTSTNNKAWTAYQSENIKFALYKAQYASGTGIAYFTNKNSEFFTTTSIVGNFQIGEQIGLLAANATGTATISANNKTVTGSGFSIFTAGDYIGYYANTTVIEFVKIDTVTSNNSITLDAYPVSSNNSTNFFKTIVGDLKRFDRNTLKMHIDNSTATTSLKFANGNVLYGEVSGAKATIQSVDDLYVSYIQPNIYKTEFTTNSTRLFADVLDDTVSRTDYTASYSDIAMAFNDNTYLTFKPTIIKSRSLEVAEGGDKSFVLRTELENVNTGTPNDSSALIDFKISNLTAYEYLIDNTGSSANAAKYISKTVRLAENFDAEDLRIWLTGTRPPGTDIQVWARFQNVNDTRIFDDIEWTRLSLKDENTFYSSSSNRLDYKEFEFTMPKLASTGFVAGGGAALNTSNSEVLRYIAPNGSIFNKYRTFAVKIVLLSATHNVVPRIKDIRAVALT